MPRIYKITDPKKPPQTLQTKELAGRQPPWKLKGRKMQTDKQDRKDEKIREE